LKTFRELYCEQHALQTERFVDVLTARAWYPHARPVRWLMQLVAPGYCAPDRDFVRSVGVLKSRRIFVDEAADFHLQPDNRRFVRRVCKARVSAERLRHIFDAVMAVRDTQPPVG
jgi:hypothetical protein